MKDGSFVVIMQLKSLQQPIPEICRNLLRGENGKFSTLYEKKTNPPTMIASFPPKLSLLYARTQTQTRTGNC